MSDDATASDGSRDDARDAVPPPPAPDAVAADLPRPDDATDPGIPDPVIPPPPAVDPFPSDASIPDPVIPPPPRVDVPVAPQPASPLAGPPEPAPVAADADQEWPVDAAPSPYIDASSTSSPGYAVLAGAIFTVLFLLLAGAVAMLVYLAGNTSFSLPAAEADPEPSNVVVEDSEPAVDPVALTGDPCSDFCVDVAGRIGEGIVAADSGSLWELSRPWAAAESAEVPAEEATSATYRSDVGALTFTVWRFGEDAAAQAAFDDLSSGYGEPVDSGTVYEDGRGAQRTFADGSVQTIVWVVLDGGTLPWVMQVQGPDDRSVQQFYLALPL